MVAGRLIGSIASVGSSSERCSAAGVRTAPMSLRSGAVRGPVPFTRWQVAQAAFSVANNVRPRSTLPTFTAVPAGSKPARMKAMRPVVSLAGKAKLGIPARHAVGDHLGQVVVGDGAAEAPEAQVDAVDQVAVRAVA